MYTPLDLTLLNSSYCYYLSILPLHWPAYLVILNYRDFISLSNTKYEYSYNMYPKSWHFLGYDLPTSYYPHSIIGISTFWITLLQFNIILLTSSLIFNGSCTGNCFFLFIENDRDIFFNIFFPLVSREGNSTPRLPATAPYSGPFRPVPFAYAWCNGTVRLIPLLGLAVTYLPHPLAPCYSRLWWRVPPSMSSRASVVARSVTYLCLAWA